MERVGDEVLAYASGRATTSDHCPETPAGPRAFDGMLRWFRNDYPGEGDVALVLLPVQSPIDFLEVSEPRSALRSVYQLCIS